MPVKHLTLQGFKEHIFDFESGKDWEFQGSLPAIIDFYADWCGPCKAVAPVLEELSDVYDGRIDFYKIDTDKETELSTLFGIQSIPTFLFLPLTGDPMLQRGAFPKNVFVEIIETRLLAEQPVDSNEDGE
jgi:thioredoxin